MKIKVLQGARSVDAPRLCDTCSNGIVLRGSADSEEQVHCSLVEKPITIRVTECNRYTDRTQAPLWVMQEIAWVLHTDAKRENIGFLNNKEWRRLNNGENLVPVRAE
jgi:hypothetical protein